MTQERLIFVEHTYPGVLSEGEASMHLLLTPEMFGSGWTIWSNGIAKCRQARMKVARHEA